MGYDTGRFDGGWRNMSQNETEISFEMKHSGSRQLYEYWSDLRGGRPTPYRSEVSARGIGRSLTSNTFILETLGEGVRRFRLAGTSLYNIFGLELRGMNALSIMDRKNHARLSSILDECLAAPSVCVLTCQATAPKGEKLSLEIFIAPLRSDFDQMNRMLGTAHILDEQDATIPPAPRKCIIVRAKTFSLNGVSEPKTSKALSGFAESAAKFDFKQPVLTQIEGGAKTGLPRRGHLKVVKD